LENRYSLQQSAQFLQTTRYFFGVFSAIKRRNTKVTFTLCPKAGARRDDDI
jgi:hypothetical protein